MIRRMRITCQKLKATDTHSEYVAFMTFPLHNSCTNAPEYYVVGAFSVFNFLILVESLSW
jgi:hypothetical protein